MKPPALISSLVPISLLASTSPKPPQRWQRRCPRPLHCLQVPMVTPAKDLFPEPRQAGHEVVLCPGHWDTTFSLASLAFSAYKTEGIIPDRQGYVGRCSKWKVGHLAHSMSPGRRHFERRAPGENFRTFKLCFEQQYPSYENPFERSRQEAAMNKDTDQSVSMSRYCCPHDPVCAVHKPPPDGTYVRCTCDEGFGATRHELSSLPRDVP